MTDRESSVTGDDTGEDLYHDLPAFQYDEQIAQLEKDNKLYKEETTLLTQRVNEATDKNVLLEQENDALKVNISMLLKTAKSELQRKDNMINDLRREISNIQFRRNKKLTKDQWTNTDVDLLIDVYKRVLNENVRNSVSSVSSGSKASECEEDKCQRKSQERKKVDFQENTEKMDRLFGKKSKSRERDERLDYNKERKPERGREDEYSRRKDYKSTGSSRSSRFDKFHESSGDRGKERNEYRRSRSLYVPSERLDPDLEKFEPSRLSRNGRYEGRRESPEFRRRDLADIRTKESFDARRRESPENRRRKSFKNRRRDSPGTKRKDSPEIRRRESPENRRRKSCDRRRSRERSKGESEITKEHPGDLRETLKNKSRNHSNEKQTDKKELKIPNGDFKLEKSPPIQENIKNSDIVIKCSNDNKKEEKSVSSKSENKNISSKSESKNISPDQKTKSEERKSKQETKIISTDSNSVSKDNNRTEVNKINISEYLKRKNNLNSEKNKKHIFDTISPLEALYCDMQKDEAVLNSHFSKNSGKIVDKGKDLQDEGDYGEDWALSFKNERVDKPKPKTLYTRRMEEKLLGIVAAERKSKNKNSGDEEPVKKDEKVAVNSLKDKKKEKKDENDAKQSVKNLKKDEKADLNKEKEEEKEPGEISEDEEENEVQEKIDNCAKPVLNNSEPVLNTSGPVLNTSGPVLNNSEPITIDSEPAPNISEPVLDKSEQSSSENAKFSASDTSSEMGTILEPPKTPDIRDSINNSSLNHEIFQNQTSEKINKSETEKEGEILQGSFETTEKSNDEKFHEGMQRLLEIQRETVTEFSPFKNNYKLIKISPLKPIDASYRQSRINGIRQIENLGDTPKKSDIYSKEDTVRLEGNSNEQISQLESSLDLSKSFVGTNDSKSTEEKESNVTPNEEQNKAVEEPEATPNSRNKGSKRRSVRSRNSNTKKEEKKDLKESVKENVRETRSSQKSDDKSDKKRRSTRSKSKSEEKIIPKTEKPKSTRNNKRKKEEIVEEVKKESRKRKKSEEPKKEPAKKMKKELTKTPENALILKETEPEKKQDVSTFEFFKPKEVTPTEKPKQFLTIQEKPSEIDETSFSNSWMTTVSSRMSVTGQIVCLETPNKCMEEFKNLIINEQTVFKTGSIFSPLPCSKVNDFMTPRRMLRNDLMLTDSEEESPMKGQVVKVSQVNEIAESVESDESEEESDESDSGDDSDSGASDFVDLL